MMASPNLGASAGSPKGAFLLSNKKTHPTLRLDAYVKQTDQTYQASPSTVGDTFVRRMNTYGSVRPSISFTGESRAQRPFKGEGSTYTMSNLPSIFYDSHGDKREGSYKFNEFGEVDTEFMKLFKNNDLMMPSERYEEHVKMKQGIEDWRRARAELFEHKKRKRILERAHKSGIVNIDSATRPGTELYAEQQQIYEAQHQAADAHNARRMEYLVERNTAADAAANRSYGEPYEPPVRSADIPLQRKSVDQEMHPFRFLNTYERLWPKHQSQWDADRAKILRHHDVRHKRYNIINHADNTIEGIRARGDPSSEPVPNMG